MIKHLPVNAQFTRHEDFENYFILNKYACFNFPLFCENGLLPGAVVVDVVVIVVVGAVEIEVVVSPKLYIF